MRIDKRLHLVVPVYAEEENGEVIAYVHATPLAEEVVDRYFMVLGQTYAAIFSQGLGLAGGPPHALRVLKHVASERGIWSDVEAGLVQEMRRLTNVAVMEKGKWEPFPLQVACDRGVITPEDRTEVENSIAFFTVASATLGRPQRAGMLRAAAELWGAQISSLPFTEWLNGLRKSTATASSGARSPAPAKPDAETANATVGGRPSRVPV